MTDTAIGIVSAKLHFRKLHLIDFFCCHSVPKSCPTLCDPIDCSTPGFSVFHYLPEFAQIHIH